MSESYLVPGSVQQKSYDLVQFDHRDSRGRVIGCRVKIWWFATTAERPAAEWVHIYYRAPGHWYGVDVHATRDTDLFGASHRPQYFSTLEEAEAYAGKRVADSRKAAAKIAAKHAAA